MSNYKKKVSFELENTSYKDTDTLKRFITIQGKILPRRSTGLNSKQQKKITKAIKRARILAFIPFIIRD